MSARRQRADLEVVEVGLFVFNSKFLRVNQGHRPAGKSHQSFAIPHSPALPLQRYQLSDPEVAVDPAVVLIFGYGSLA
ncbi:MAG: hypothetical protein LUO89_15000 [Methanothrix sp.]|nr:hypothetical protein [Methanothrix sp.]